MPGILAGRRRPLAVAATAVTLVLLGIPGAGFASSSVYKWVDAAGVTHLSSVKPPAGTRYERVTLAASRRSTQAGVTSHPAGVRSGTQVASTAQVARRNETITALRNRECVVALESIDRLARGGEAVDPAEFSRLQQTADQNCSADPAVRRQQEDMAARLRVAKGDACVDARNRLADMLEPGRKPTREQVKVQQEFIESHCTAPVR